MSVNVKNIIENIGDLFKEISDLDTAQEEGKSFAEIDNICTEITYLAPEILRNSVIAKREHREKRNQKTSHLRVVQ